jgi:hypothetical protein
MSEPGSDSYRVRWGPWAAVHHAVVQRLAHRLGVRIYGIFVRRLDAPTGPVPDVPGFAFRTFGRGEAAALLGAARLGELGLSADFVHAALAKGDECDAVLCGDEIVSFIWSAYTPTHDHDGVFVDVGPRSRYAYFAYTAKAYRGRHLPVLFRPLRDRSALARGCTRSVSYVSVDNHSSMRLARASGSKRIGHALYIRRPSWFVALHTHAVREAGIRFYRPG